MSLVNLTKASQSEEFTHNFDEYGAYLYFERNDKDKPSCYENILGIAKKRIIIIDPHLSIKEDLILFEKMKTEGVDVKILAVCDYVDKKDDVKSYFDALQNKFKKNLNNYKLEFCCFKPNPWKRKNTSWDKHNDEQIFIWHDRYLLVDNRAFLVGSSMNNQVSGNKSFGIYEVKDSAVMVQFIIDLYDKYNNLLEQDKNGWRFHHK